MEDIERLVQGWLLGAGMMFISESTNFLSFALLPNVLFSNSQLGKTEWKKSFTVSASD